VTVGLAGTPEGRAWLLLASVVGALVAGLGWSASRRPAALLLLSALHGFGVFLALDQRSMLEQRSAAVFAAGSARVEGHVRGTLLKMPEPDFRGGRVLWLRGRLGGEDATGARPSMTLRLVVAPSPAAPTARVDALVPGDVVRVWCRLYRPRAARAADEIDPRLRMAGAGIDAFGSVKSARLVELERQSSLPAARLLGWVKGAVRRRIDRWLSPGSEQRALAGAMLLGDRAAIEPATVRQLRGAGLIHLIAISGLHVGMVAVVVVSSVERLRLPPLLRWGLACGALYGFAQLVGLRPSVFRATVAVAALQTGRMLGRHGDPINTLALVATAIVLSSPCAIADPGLQLTVVATAGILAGSVRRSAAGPSGVGIASGFRVSASAYLSTAALSANLFGWLAPIALLSNLLAVPLCAAVLASGLAVSLVGELPLVGAPAGYALDQTTRAMLGLARVTTDGPVAAFPVARASAASLACYYASGLAWLRCRSTESGPSVRRAAAACFALCVLWIHVGPPPPRGSGGIEVTAIDVGQGQSIAIRGPDGGLVLVDAAGSAHPTYDPGERVVLPFVLASAGRRIELLVLSHDHLDHVGGTAALIRALEIGQLCLPPGYHRSERLATLAQTSRSRGVSIRLCEQGSRVPSAGLPILVLGPDRQAHLRGSVNDASVALLVGTRPHRLLIPGDLERAGERALLESGMPLRSEALVLSHHGSRSGSAAAFLEHVRPRLTLVSCGEGNRFGHPHAESRRRVRLAKATLLRTDLDGSIRLRSRPGGWDVVSSRR
jgi:competence protein ComEC